MEEAGAKKEHSAIRKLWLQAFHKIIIIFKKQKAMRVHRLFRVFIIRKQKTFFHPNLIETWPNTNRKRNKAIRWRVWQKALDLSTLFHYHFYHHHILSWVILRTALNVHDYRAKSLYGYHSFFKSQNKEEHNKEGDKRGSKKCYTTVESTPQQARQCTG